MPGIERVRSIPLANKTNLIVCQQLIHGHCCSMTGEHAQMVQQSAQLTCLQIKDLKNSNFLVFSLPVKVLQNSTFFNDCILYQVIASL